MTKAKKKKAESTPKFKPENLRLEYTGVGQGIHVYTAFAQNADGPMGTIWVRIESDAFRQVMAYVMDIYVPVIYRRKGVGRFLYSQLLAMYGMLKTGNGSKDVGKALLLATGWKQNKQTGEWYLRGKVRKVPASEMS